MMNQSQQHWFSRIRRIGVLAVLLMLVFVMGVTIPIAHAADTVIATTAVGNSPFSLGVNATTNRIYVGNTGNSTVSVIDGLTNNVIATIPGEGFPYAVGVNATTNRIYIANAVSGSSTVSVIDGLTNTVIATIPVEDFPFGLAVNATTNRIYITNDLGNIVSVIDGLTNTVIATIPGEDFPDAVEVNAVTNRIYVANIHTSSVLVIDGLTNTVIASVPVANGSLGIGVSATTNRIYVASGDTGTVSVIDGLTNTVIATIPVGGEPNGVGVNEATNRVYVTNGANKLVSVIDGLTNTVIATIPVSRPADVGINATTNRIYVTNYDDGTVSVIADEPSPLTTSLKVQYLAGNTFIHTELIMPFFKIINTGETAVPLNDIKMRYWYTWDNPQPQTDHCLWGLGSWAGCLNLTKTFVRVQPPLDKADYYVEFGFTPAAGSLAPGDSTQAIINWFYKQDWSLFDQTNDYSFDPTACTSYIDNPRMTLYLHGVLIWGTEPTLAARQAQTATPTFVPPIH